MPFITVSFIVNSHVSFTDFPVHASNRPCIKPISCGFVTLPPDVHPSL
ncbi:MAG: hypothetical protein NTU61_05340 [Candidatus Altiarchaeota archaeon]|nr:hypothetical protein [Candidatus Altiarchaeota archaeon]